MSLISVVIPVYNAAAALPATLASVQAQRWHRWEAILVDDGSTDDSLTVAQHVAARDARIRVAHNPGKGPSAARNYGAMTCAKGDIVAFCDADDLWTPRKLDDVAYAVLRKDADVVFGRVGFFADTPDTITSRSTVPNWPLTVPTLLAENPVCTLSNLSMRRDLFVEMGGLREDMVHNEDLEFLVTLAGAGAQIQGMNHDHVQYRLSPHGLSSDLAAMRESRQEVLRTALRYGHHADTKAEARYLRYLARRAMRLDKASPDVVALVCEGLATNPKAFLTPIRRGVPTTLGGLLFPLLPRAVRHRFFAR